MHKMVVIAGIVAASTVMRETAQAERICEAPECRTVECWPVPGGRRCRRECRRRCWNSAPRVIPLPQDDEPEPAPRLPEYVPPAPRYVPSVPRYEPPRYEAPRRHVALLPLDPALLILAGADGLIALIMFVMRARRLRREIQSVEHTTMSARDLERRMRASIDEADRLIANHLADAYRRGRSGKEKRRG